MEPAPEHRLAVVAEPGCTVGECSCGHWRRQATVETVRITGLSREDALRSAHELHARGLDAAA
jgi:hypothetical protein